MIDCDVVCASQVLVARVVLILQYATFSSVAGAFVSIYCFRFEEGESQDPSYQHVHAISLPPLPIDIISIAPI